MSSQNTSHSPTNKIRKRFFYLVVFLLLGCSLVLRLALALNREIDIDEFQHLHAAWMVSRHYLSYKNFCDNHTPLFYYLLLPLFRLCREGPGLNIVDAILMCITKLGILCMTYLLGRIRYKQE